MGSLPHTKLAINGNAEYLVLFAPRIDILDDIEKKYNYNFNISFDNKEYEVQARILYDKDNLWELNRDNYELNDFFRKVNPSVKFIPIKWFRFRDKFEWTISDLSGRKWRYFRVYSVHITKYSDWRKKISGLSAYSNQDVAWRQILWDDKPPTVDITFKRYYNEVKQIEIAHWRQFVWYVNTRYCFDFTWNDNLQALKRSAVYDDNGNLLCENCNKIWDQPENKVFSNRLWKKVYHFVAEDYNGNVADYPVEVEFIAPQISIEDIDLQHWTITSLLSEDMDKTAVKFLRVRNWQQAILSDKWTNKSVFTWWTEQLEFTWKVFEVDNKILFYTSNGQNIWYLDLDNWKISLDDYYSKILKPIVKFDNWYMTVNIVSATKTYYIFTLPWYRLTDWPNIHNWNYETVKITNSYLWDFDWGWCIKDKNQNRCAMFISAKWNVFVDENYRSRFIWKYEYNEELEQVKITVYNWDFTDTNKIVDWSYKVKVRN